jgi:hypothetical protein
MKELLYFSSSDVMVQVVYKPRPNALDYYSHRKLSFGERIIVEQYLLNNIAIKTDYYNKHPSMLNYIGINSSLVKELNQFHLRNTINGLKEKEKEVESSVKDLIDSSLSGYYFEQIGNVLIDIRNLLKGKYSYSDIHFNRNRLSQLLHAYNLHSGRDLKLWDVLPEELRTIFSENG